MDAAKSRRFRVALTGDFFQPDGSLCFPDIGLQILEQAAHIEVTRFAEHRPVIGADQIGDAQGVIIVMPRLNKESLSKSDNLLGVGRFGVGYEMVDVSACTEADVAAFITPGAVDRPVAEATVCWMLALSHHVLAKDRLVRTGQWHERSRYMGTELRGRTLGIVGLGRIGRAVLELLKGFGMNQPLAFDPQLDHHAAAQLGVKLVSLDDLLGQSDFVSVHCPLTEQTKDLIGARELGLMKKDAYLLNVARGGIVNEDALYEALKARRIAGAGVDCFVGEPVTWPHRLGELDNVLLAPHHIAVTYELCRDIGRSVCQSMLDLSLGKKPHGLLNPEVFDKPSFQAKRKRLIGV